ncbi:DNA polymerase theta-like [Dendroctonus ponderosae]|uniref:DNA polymerase theta-like n=1 Tax=Dendroctonus ponderosae TaxID=77166 RepID=UPI002035A46E|nr:DNA polymerase theta-like [Dendroctonus ponderosae]
MLEHDCSMNDTLDNFTFQNISCDDKNAVFSSNRISFDDSAFLDNVSFDFDQIETSQKPPLQEQDPVVEEKTSQNVLYGKDYQENDMYLEALEESAEASNTSNDQGNTHESDKDSYRSANKPINNDSFSLSPPKELESPDRLLSQNVGQPNLEDKQSSSVLLENGSPHSNKDSQTSQLPTYELSAWNLPDAVLERYKARKVTKMFQWQFECLNNPKVLHGSSNLIYSAPTSAGKTLIAEILALKTIFDRKKKVIFILPFVSIVREKMYYFQDILSSSGVRAEGFMGSYNPPGGFNSVQLAICTIEKANSLINRLLEEERLAEIGSVFVDEMHLLGDPNRGYLLELLLTKLRYICLKDLNIQIQIIGMSATLPNLGQLARWLDSELYSTSFRPIPLYEQASICGDIFDNDMKIIRKLDTLPELGVDTDHVLQLCLETIQDSCSVLIFCPTKNWCENLAQQLSQAFSKLGNSQSPLGQLLRAQIRGDLIIEVLEQLKFCPVGLDSILKKTVSFGIAFHHAGLTMDERDIIEGAFRNGAIKVLVATSTLSSGVNLPARRVIIRSPVFGGRPLNLLTYRQMIGRAGRMGKDSKGESILICQKAEYKIAKELMSFELSPVESCLEGAGKLKRAILEVIASGVALSPDDIALFTNCTLMSITNADDQQDQLAVNPIDATIDFLKKHEFIRLQKANGADEQYVATSLGKACLSSSIAPDEGLTLFTELEKARQCFVLETELHLIYLVTPYSACQTWGNIDWMMYLDFWDKLSSAMKRVGKLVGVSDPFIVSATRGKIDCNSSKGFQKLMVHKRFFVALALQDLVNEVPLATVCAKFNCNRGMLQSLQQSASTFAGMVTAFSKQLGWASLEILLAQFQDRMQFGVSRDLLDLMRLPSLNGKLARILYKAGVETVIELANRDVAYIENILCRAGPFESAKERDGESKTDTNDRNKFRTVWITGKEGLTEREAAQLLVNNARNYLVIEVGLKEAKWNSQSNPDKHDSTFQLRANEGTKETKLSSNRQLIIDASSKSSLSENAKNHNSVCSGDGNVVEGSVIGSAKEIYFGDCSENVVLATEDDAVVNGIETSFKTLSITPSKETEIVSTQAPIGLNISESSLFSSSGSLEKSKSEEQFTDSSFTLQLSDDQEIFTETIDEFNSQDDFETAIKNIDISHAIQKNCNYSVDQSDNITLSNYSGSSASDININVLGKRGRSSSGSSSEELFLEATPNKKCKNSKILTPFASTITKYSQLSLDNINSIKAPRFWSEFRESQFET